MSLKAFQVGPQKAHITKESELQLYLPRSPAEIRAFSLRWSVCLRNITRRSGAAHVPSLPHLGMAGMVHTETNAVIIQTRTSFHISNQNHKTISSTSSDAPLKIDDIIIRQCPQEEDEEEEPQVLLLLLTPISTSTPTSATLTPN